jgi:hypothetical protein
MTLQKIDLPRVSVFLPTSNITVFVRPYTVKEEKILLNAINSIKDDMPSEEVNKIVIGSVNQILELITNLKELKVDVNSLPFFETELLFIKSRSISDNNILTVTFTNRYIEDEKEKTREADVSFDLNKVSIDYPVDVSPLGFVDIDESHKVKFRFPTYEENEKARIENREINYTDMIEEIHFTNETETKTITRSDISSEEINDWYDGLTRKHVKEIVKFFANLPQVHVSQTIKFGEDEHVVELRGLNDFFG